MLDYVIARKNPLYPTDVILELHGSPLFAIRQKIVSPHTTEGTIILLGPLDFETQSMYHLTILANVSSCSTEYTPEHQLRSTCIFSHQEWMNKIKRKKKSRSQCRIVVFLFLNVKNSMEEERERIGCEFICDDLCSPGELFTVDG